MELTNLFKWQKALEKTVTPMDYNWEKLQTKRRNSPAGRDKNKVPPEGYLEVRGELFYSVLSVTQTDSGMVRVDVDSDAYNDLNADFWTVVGDMSDHLSEAENKNLEIKVRPV